MPPLSIVVERLPRKIRLLDRYGFNDNPDATKQSVALAEDSSPELRLHND